MIERYCEIFVLRAKQKKVSNSICRRRLIGGGGGDWIGYWFDIEEFEKTTQRGYIRFCYQIEMFFCRDILHLQGVVYYSLNVPTIVAFDVALK